MKQIAIILTTFLRDELAAQTIHTVRKFMPEDAQLCVVTQGDSTIEGQVRLPFDAGLSAARNAGVDWAWNRGCEFCLITADSIQFTEAYELGAVTGIMRRYGYGLVGFDLAHRVPWEGTLKFTPDKPYPFQVEKGFRLEDREKVYKRVDICRNFFLATTRSLRVVRWDEELKLREHEDFFWRYKQMRYQCRWTDRICGRYVDSKPPQYQRMRKRMYHEFTKKVRDKWSTR